MISHFVQIPSCRGQAGREGFCEKVRTVVHVRSPLFWDVTQRRSVVADVSVQPIRLIFKAQATARFCVVSFYVAAFTNGLFEGKAAGT